jgi:hypothetical protein
VYSIRQPGQAKTTLALFPTTDLSVFQSTLLLNGSQLALVAASKFIKLDIGSGSKSQVATISARSYGRAIQILSRRSRRYKRTDWATYLKRGAIQQQEKPHAVCPTACKILAFPLFQEEDGRQCWKRKYKRARFRTRSRGNNNRDWIVTHLELRQTRIHKTELSRPAR